MEILAWDANLDACFLLGLIMAGITLAIWVGVYADRILERLFRRKQTPPAPPPNPPLDVDPDPDATLRPWKKDPKDDRTTGG